MLRSPFRPLRWAAVSLAAAALAACTAPPPVPDDHFYRLQAEAPAKPLETRLLNGVLELDEISAEGKIGNRALLYSEPGRAGELKEYNYHYWVEPPKTMLQDQLAAYLRAARVADQVATRRMRVEHDYELSGKLLRLERTNTTPARATVEMELSLRRPKDGKLLLLNVYRSEMEARSGGMADAIEAYNRGLTDILARLVADIARL